MIIYKVRPDGVYDGQEEFQTDDPDRAAIPRGYTRVAPPDAPAGFYAVLNGTWRLIKGVKPEYVDPNKLPLPQDILEANKKAEVRSARDAALKDSDWTQMVDSPLSVEGKASWAAYRQALRDIPQQAEFPWNVTWPTVPVPVIVEPQIEQPAE